MPIRAILWDFGDTLADQRWMQRHLPGVPGWTDLYREFSMRADLADQWNTGVADWMTVASWFAAQLDVDAARVRNHMEECCKAITFFPLVRELSEHCRLRQAIVTVNPDIFSKFVVPSYALADRFDPIITSWQARTLDKSALCELAVAELGGRRDECLLIDDRLENVEGWRKLGGAAYHFQGERDLFDRFADLTASPV